MSKLLHKESLNWKGVDHDLELYESDSLPDGYINQCQAVCFVDSENLVLFKHIDGYYSLPGGSIEDGEKFEETLSREVMEESACEVKKFELIGYVKVTETKIGQVKYQLRFWADVNPLNQPVEDPAGKALERILVPIEKVNELLNWGDRGKILLDLAKRKHHLSYNIIH
jgi:ADP-ribose pyrophosphatase YjhB (NUDIX family)